ncbi:MAG TPA: nitroreductase family protein [Aggregatilineaceae bacterium]|nr:nitroreductase family protein [Anaerolineae bacterium]HMM27003.1 nitroreductase family protein [Aggregatilineaceae bacterium]
MESEQALLALIQARRSIRRTLDRPVPHRVIERLLEAARWAPSAHNRQPWRFAVIESVAWRGRLAAAMGECLRADLAADGLEADAIERQVRRSYERISSAPLVIVFFLSLADMDRYPDPARQEAEHLMAVQSVALAAQNMLLQAHAEGLGACWMCAPLFCPDVVRAELNLPADWIAQGLLTAGYPAEERQKSREPLEPRVRWY